MYVLWYFCTVIYIFFCRVGTYIRSYEFVTSYSPRVNTPLWCTVHCCSVAENRNECKTRRFIIQWILWNHIPRIPHIIIIASIKNKNVHEIGCTSNVEQFAAGAIGLHKSAVGVTPFSSWKTRRVYIIICVHRRTVMLKSVLWIIIFYKIIKYIYDKNNNIINTWSYIVHNIYYNMCALQCACVQVY